MTHFKNSIILTASSSSCFFLSLLHFFSLAIRSTTSGRIFIASYLLRKAMGTRLQMTSFGFSVISYFTAYASSDFKNG